MRRRSTKREKSELHNTVTGEMGMEGKGEGDDRGGKEKKKEW